MTWLQLAMAIALGVYVGGWGVFRAPVAMLRLRAAAIVGFSKARGKVLCPRGKHRPMPPRYRPIGESREAPWWTKEQLCRDCEARTTVDTVRREEVPDRSRLPSPANFLASLFEPPPLPGDEWKGQS